MGTIFNGLYSLTQNNSQTGFIRTTLIPNRVRKVLIQLQEKTLCEERIHANTIFLTWGLFYHHGPAGLVAHHVQQGACAQVACDLPAQPALKVPCHHYQPHPHVHQLLRGLHKPQHALQMLHNVMVSSLSCHGVAHPVLKKKNGNLYTNKEHKFSESFLYYFSTSVPLMFIY